MTERTIEEVLATAWSGVGQWWPNDWWPNGRSSYNDCAAFVSWALYGLNGREPFYTYVPHIMDRAIREGRWHGGRGLVARAQNSDGAKGMQAGDVVILDWRFRGSRDHVGIALAAPRGGTVRVIQANNGGGGLGNANTRDPAEVVSYSTKYVLGYYRPAYATATPAGDVVAELPTLSIKSLLEGEPMKLWTFWREAATGKLYVNTGRELVHLGREDYIKLRDLFRLMGQREPGNGWVTPPDINKASEFFNLDTHGMRLLAALTPTRKS